MNDRELLANWIMDHTIVDIHYGNVVIDYLTLAEDILSKWQLVPADAAALAAREGKK